MPRRFRSSLGSVTWPLEVTVASMVVTGLRGVEDMQGSSLHNTHQRLTYGRPKRNPLLRATAALGGGYERLSATRFRPQLGPGNAQKVRSMRSKFGCAPGWCTPVRVGGIG